VINNLDALGANYLSLKEGENVVLFLSSEIVPINHTELIRKNSLDFMLGELSDSEHKMKEDEIRSRMDIGLIESEIKLHKESIFPVKYKTMDEIKKIAFSYLDSISVISDKNKNPPISPLSISGIDEGRSIRMLETRLNSSIAYLGPTSRLGLGDSIIAGSLVYEIIKKSDSYVNGNFNNIMVTHSNIISEDKVFVIQKNGSSRSGINGVDTGINLIIDRDKNLFCVFCAEEYWRKILYFNVIT